MEKSTYRVLMVLLLGILVTFVVMGYFKLTLSSDNQLSLTTLDVDAEELKEPIGELRQNNTPIGFRYMTEGQIMRSS